MALNATELMEIEAALSDCGGDGAAVAALRQRFPRLAWTRCDATDVCETPFRSFAGFDIHLLDSSDHCAAITDDPARATGIILAKRGAP